VAPLASTWSDISLAISVMLKLALVLALIYAALYVLRRWQGGGLASARRQLAVVESLRLSPRQTLHLVRVCDRVWLIGATDQALNLLAEGDPTVLQPVAAPTPAGETAALALDDGPAVNRGQFRAGSLAASVPPAVVNFIDLLRARLTAQADRPGAK
jgi:flagellar biosynthetic protein FliO